MGREDGKAEGGYQELGCQAGSLREREEENTLFQVKMDQLDEAIVGHGAFTCLEACCLNKLGSF